MTEPRKPDVMPETERKEIEAPADDSLAGKVWCGMIADRINNSLLGSAMRDARIGGLIQQLNDKDPDKRKQAEDDLVNTGRKALPQLEKTVADPKNENSAESKKAAQSAISRIHENAPRTIMTTQIQKTTQREE